MTSLINKIEKLIKREKSTPERKDDSKKSSSEILSELFSAFNADPPKIDDCPIKKSKKSKKKHKKEKKRRNKSASNSSGSEDGEYSHKRKKRKKSKSKKRARESRSPSYPYPLTPVLIKPDPDLLEIKVEADIKSEKTVEIKTEKERDVKHSVSFKSEHSPMSIEPQSPPLPIPVPDLSPLHHTETVDLRQKLDSKKNEKAEYITDNDKSKGKIQIKNLKFSTVFEETVKKAEEEARKRAEKYEEGEYTDSSSSTEKETVYNSQFPKTSDPGGILKKQAEEEKLEDEKLASKKSKQTESLTKSSQRDRSRSRKRSRSKSRKSRSPSSSKKRRHRSSSKSKRSSRHRSTSRSKRRSSRSRSKRRSRSRSRHRLGRRSPLGRHRSRRSRSPSGVKLADSEKKRLLEVARRNAINMLKNGAVPAGAAALPPHTRNQVMAAIQSGGKSVDELTDFCKHLSKKEALGELSSVSSNDDGMSENEDTLAFHHPFLVKEKAPIVLNIRGGAPLPTKSSTLPIANKEELSLQFPVSSGTQHREKASEWVPVSPKKDMQVAKLNTPPSVPAKTKTATTSTEVAKIPERPTSPPPYMKAFTSGAQLTSVPALPPVPPGPQAYPPGVDLKKMQDVANIVSQKLSLLRKEQEETEMCATYGFGWSAKDTSLGEFTGTTGAQILTPRELASGTQAWAKKLLSDKEMRAVRYHHGLR